MVAAYCFHVVVNNTLTSVCIIPLDWGMTTRRSVLRLVGTTLLPGGGSGGGGDLGGMIFPKLLPPGEPTKPFTEHRNIEIWGHLRNDGEENHDFPFTTDWLTDGEYETCICALCSNKYFAWGIFRACYWIFFLVKGTIHLNVELFEDLECALKQGGVYEVRMEKVWLYIIQEIIMNNWSFLALDIT